MFTIFKLSEWMSLWGAGHPTRNQARTHYEAPPTAFVRQNREGILSGRRGRDSDLCRSVERPVKRCGRGFYLFFVFGVYDCAASIQLSKTFCIACALLVRWAE